ncbi:hypothetical protein V499_03426 [Pseudogymnoascus sp. VKM F-103]|nr:hypothetical protein V499_03426 [Pseudogymnoascus sp. VKM F-103]
MTKTWISLSFSTHNPSNCGIRTVNPPHPTPFTSPNTPLPLPQHLLQKLLKAQRHKPIPIIIIALKRIRHPLKRNTRLNEQIKAQTPLPSLIKRPEQEPHKPLTQPIPKRHQRVPELIQADVARAIGVEAVEEGAPGREEGPEAAELAELDCAAAGGVEHADHEGDGVGVEGRPVAVYEGGGELGFGEVAAGSATNSDPPLSSPDSPVPDVHVHPSHPSHPYHPSDPAADSVHT